MPLVTGGDDFVGVRPPGEGLGVACVVFADETIDGGLEIDKRVEGAMLQPTSTELREETLDRVEP